MKFEKLGNISDIIAGQSPPSSTYNSEGNGIPFFQGKADYGEKYPTVRYWCAEPAKISLPDDILISMRAPVGPVNINKVKACIGRGLSAIRVKKNVSRDFIYFWLKQNQHIIAAKQTGSTFKAITQKILSEIIVPFPEYTTQLHIASILSKAENLIAQRKESIRLLDEFLKSTFLEMFGDPVRNEKGWNKSALKEFARIRIGPFGSLLHREDYVQGGVPLVNPSHIQDGKIEIDLDLTISKNKIISLSAYVMHEGDVVLGRRGEIGRCAVITKKENGFLCGTGSIFIRPEKDLQPIYLYNVISSVSMRKVLENSANGITMKNLNSGIVEEIKIPVPPLELQTQFARIVEKTEALKSQYQQSLQELENLYGSLSQKAFRGELTTNNAVSGAVRSLRTSNLLCSPEI